MSEYFNLNENEAIKKAERKFPELKKYLNKKYIFPALILLAIPVTVSLALVTQEIRSRASEFPATPATPPTVVTPTPVLNNPLEINTPNATLKAEDFSIIVNGKIYTAKNANIISTSDSGSEATTLRSRWIESDGVPMILDIYFKRSLSNPNQFEIIDIAINDGKNPPQTTIYFKGDKSWGNYGNYGYSAFWQNINLVEPFTDAKLNFRNVTILPFALYAVNQSPTPTIAPTATLTPTPKLTSTPTPTKKLTPTPTPKKVCKSGYVICPNGTRIFRKPPSCQFPACPKPTGAM